MAKQVEFREYFHLAPIGRDSSGSSRIRIIGVPIKYDVHYKNDSSFTVNQLSCPRSLSDNFHPCLYCNENVTREDIINYSRYLCLAWDIPKRRWGVLSASLQTFSEIASQLKAKLFTKENILKGETPDILLQGINKRQVAIALIEDSINTKHFGDERPTHEDLLHYAKAIGGKSFWRFNNYAEIVQKEQPARSWRERVEPARDPLLYPTPAQQNSIIDIDSFRASLNEALSTFPDARRLREIEQPIKPEIKPEIKPDIDFKPPVPKRNKDFWDLI